LLFDIFSLAQSQSRQSYRSVRGSTHSHRIPEQVLQHQSQSDPYPAGHVMPKRNLDEDLPKRHSDAPKMDTFEKMFKEEAQRYARQRTFDDLHSSREIQSSRSK
jgi:hypothetical protein